MFVDAETQLTLLLGFPVAHSLSPLIHNTAFRAQKLNRLYVAASVRPPDLAAAVAGLRALGAAGANVTIPHKAAVLPLADSLSPQAQAIGAINTLVVQARKDGPSMLYGDNTDIAGFLEPLHAHAASLHQTSMLIFGAGGAARAVAYALLTAFQPDRLTLAARTTAKAEALARDLAPYDAAGVLRVARLEEAGPDVRASRLLVNATPLGTTPDVRATPWPHAADF
ncbi:MAG: shikimate dehydrogenase family protein, partial [Rhodothermales bacterium]